MKQAIISAGILKKAGCHKFRHSFAKRLLERGYDIRTIQTLPGLSTFTKRDYDDHYRSHGASAS